jgi:hypothetical protein
MAKAAKVQEQLLESIMWNCLNVLRGPVGSKRNTAIRLWGWYSSNLRGTNLKNVAPNSCRSMAKHRHSLKKTFSIMQKKVLYPFIIDIRSKG